MTKPCTIRIPRPLYDAMLQALFPGDDDEHGVVLAAGVCTTDRGTRLLVREVFPARDGVDYVPGNRGYRMLTPEFIMEKASYCAEHQLAYLAVHNHDGRGRVRFSKIDLVSHERGYPALLDIVDAPVGALVVADGAVAGDIWFPSSERLELERLVIVGPRLEHLFPNPQADPSYDPVYDRHARLFGDIGQQRLHELKVGVIGAGGGGSQLVQMLAHLGVGHIVAIDFDRVEQSNLPRIVGSTPADVGRLKVDVAQRLAQQTQPDIRFDAIVGDFVDESVGLLLRDADMLFLATDNILSRYIFNALVHQYLVPGFQVGVKVRPAPQTNVVEDIVVANRPVLPYQGGGCLQCANLIPSSLLQKEALSEEERRAQSYLDEIDIPEPSVITLNAISTSLAANDALFMVTGLTGIGTDMGYQHYFALDREVWCVDGNPNPSCHDCGVNDQSRFGRGDAVRLPCRQSRT